MRTFILGLVGAAFVGACAPVSYVSGVALTHVDGEQQSERVTDANFTIGVERTAVVGEPLVRVKDYRRVSSVKPMVQPTEAVRISLPAAQLVASGANTVPLLRDVDGGRYARVGDHAVKIDAEGAFDGVVMQMTAPGTYVLLEEPATISPSSVRFTARNQVRSSAIAEGENYEIIFTGRDDHSVRFQYREYTTEDMARAAFSQDLTYPASANTIRFRNLTIAISHLGPDSITYRITERRLTSSE